MNLRTAGSSTARSADTLDRRRRSLAPLVIVTVAALVFAILLILVRLYIAIAILVIGHARGWWRWLFLAPAIAMPVFVALSRLYRGEHHPTDLLASVLFAALWLTAASLLIKPDT